jgi:hypothetical protein
MHFHKRSSLFETLMQTTVLCKLARVTVALLQRKADRITYTNPHISQAITLGAD